MWFKNLMFYRLNVSVWPNDNTLDAALKRRPFYACGKLDRVTRGWIAPAPHHADRLVFRRGTCVLLALKRDEKVLPASVLKAETARYIADLEAREQRKVGRKEAQSLREVVADSLLPRAFTRQTVIRLCVDTVHGWLMIDSGTAARADEVLELLRETLAEVLTEVLPVRRVSTVLSPQTAMTMWIRDGAAPVDFDLDRDCELRAPDEHGAVVKFSRQSLIAPEVSRQLELGLLVNRLGLMYADKVRFILTETLDIKRFQMLDSVQENLDGDDAAALFESEFYLMSTISVALLNDLMMALEGEENT